MKKQILIFSVLFVAFLLLFCANKTEEISPVFTRSGTEKPEVTLISVFDNNSVNSELKTSWGFASIIKTPAENILFDTGGDADILLFNMKKMNIDPKSIDKVFISHEHGDHIDGLAGFLEKNNKVTVYIPASFSGSVKNMIRARGVEYKEITEAAKITGFMYSTGELPGPPTEQSLIIDSKKGIIVMTGCAHPGIVKIVEKAKKMTQSKDVYLVVGGFHRPPLSVAKEFRELGVKKATPTHCTGDDVRQAFAEEYKEDFVEYGVGKIVEIK